MSRTRKTPTATSTASPNSEGAQTPTELAKGFQQRLLIEQTNQRNEQLVATQTPDVVEDAIKSNLINGKSELDHTNTSTRFVDDLLNLNGGGPLLTNKSNNTEPNTSDLLTRYSELNTVVATTTSNVFGAFATTNSNETAVTPGTH